MTIKIQGDKITFPDDSEQTTAYDGSSGGGIPEAPIDGKQYGRQDAEWTEVIGGGDVTSSVTYTGVYTEALDIPSTGEVTYTKVPFAGEGWVDGKYTVDTDGSFIVNAKFQWSLINPASNQAFRYCVVFVNDIQVYRNAHGVNTEYPYGSLNQTTWVGNLKKGDVVDIRAVQGNVESLTQTIAIGNAVSIAMLGGSGSGGGSTPEALVWEDKTADRAFDTEYTNTNDVPLYVQIYVNMDGKGNYIQMVIDGESQGYAGNGAGGTVDGFNSLSNPLYIIPAGSKYKVAITGTNVGSIWKEARMPLAIAVGGEAQAPVAFNLQLTSSTTTKQGVNTPIVLDKAVVDTENGLKDGGYEVQKDGLYDISFIAKAQSSDGNLNNFYGYVYLNGTFFMQGSADPYKGGASPTGGKGFTVSGSSVLDLKKGDVITLELYANTADSADTTVHLMRCLYQVT